MSSDFSTTGASDESEQADQTECGGAAAVVLSAVEQCARWLRAPPRALQIGASQSCLPDRVATDNLAVLLSMKYPATEKLLESLATTDLIK
jgi:hypothetical protein